MNRDELFELARECGMTTSNKFVQGGAQFTGDCLARFAFRIIEAEREACASFADVWAEKGHTVAETIAAAIRARGTFK